MRKPSHKVGKGRDGAPESDGTGLPSPKLSAGLLLNPIENSHLPDGQQGRTPRPRGCWPRQDQGCGCRPHLAVFFHE